MKPDYYLVLPWHFKKEFLEREQIARGVKFIFPLPNIEIIGEGNSALKIGSEAENSQKAATKKRAGYGKTGAH